MTRKNDSHPLEALTWLVNGTLDEEERRRVEAHLAECERCRREYRFLKALRQSVKTHWEEDSPGELGWARLQRRIQDEESSLSEHRWRRVGVAAAVMVIVLQAGVIGYLVQRAPGETAYQPLGSIEEPVLQVRFREDATEGQLRRLLLEAEVEVVGGPGGLGIYRVRPLHSRPGALARARGVLANSPLVEEVQGP